MNFLTFHRLGIIIPTDFHIFQRGWNHQPAKHLPFAWPIIIASPDHTADGCEILHQLGRLKPHKSWEPINHHFQLVMSSTVFRAIARWKFLRNSILPGSTCGWRLLISFLDLTGRWWEMELSHMWTTWRLLFAHSFKIVHVQYVNHDIVMVRHDCSLFIHLFFLFIHAFFFRICSSCTRNNAPHLPNTGASRGASGEFWSWRVVRWS